jgi:hypothetical protein
MGWWSKDIMGGDSPLDMESIIYEACEVNQFPEEDEDGGSLKPSHFEKHLPKILGLLRAQENNAYYDEHAIGFQVLGVLMMKAGAKIDEELKKEILRASSGDTWAQEDSERKTTVENFHQALEAYDGRPLEIRSRGLFEVIAEKLQSGDPGLVNIGKGIS